MSRNTDKIRKALEAKGYKVDELEWEPIGPATEMCGNSGGWSVTTEEPFYHIMGYNIQEVMEEIDTLPSRGDANG